MGDAMVTMLLAGAALVVIELARSVPAWIRVRVTRSSDGMSPISIGVLAGTCVGWIAVAVMVRSPAAVVATLVWLVFHLLLLREVVRTTPAFARTIGYATALSGTGLSLVAVIGLLVGHLADALGIAIGVASASYSLPALFSGMTSRTTTGLSLPALLVNSAEGAIYLTAGLGVGGIAPAGNYVIGYILFGGLALASNVPRLVRTSWRRLAGRDGEGCESVGADQSVG